MGWQDQLKGDSPSWLLEGDSQGVRFLAMRDLSDSSPNSPELPEARRRAHEEGPIASILAKMNEAGYWAKPGPGYEPKYRGTVWSLINLAQLGAHASCDDRIGKAGSYILDHSLTDGGLFSMRGTPSTTLDCPQGNLCVSFRDLGFDDPRLDEAGGSGCGRAQRRDHDRREGGVEPAAA